MTTTVSGSQITFNDNTTQNTSAYGGGFAMRNRIINGDMRIDQRNNGASYNVQGGEYSVDRWATNATQTSKFSAQQNAGSVTPPAGYSYYLGLTSTAATTVGAGDIFNTAQYIEGFNFADLGWGTANAQTVTISFWVRSSLTGTFGGALTNSGVTRSYPFSYTISAANTWEYKTITIAGDTTGTWIGATNGIGVRMYFSLGTGSTRANTAGAWAAGDFRTATGATNVVSTNGATLYITGVQLEKGSTATSFDYRPYGQELALCQRYYYKIYPNENSRTISTSAQAYSTTGFVGTFQFPVPMRSRPTALEQSGTATHYAVWGAGTNAIACNSVIIYNASTTNLLSVVEGTVASGLVAGNATAINTSAATGQNAYLGWSAEL